MAKLKVFYGWFLLAALFLVYVCMGVFPFYTGSVMGGFITGDPNSGISVTYWGFAFTIYILCQGLPAPFIGILVDRFGSRFTMILGSLVVTAGGLLLAFFPGPITLIIGFSIMLSFGSSMAGLIPVQTIINMWFHNKRALAMGIVMIAGGVGIALIGPIVTFIIKIFGGAYNYGWLFLGIVGVVNLLLTILFVRNTPEDMGQKIDGGQAPIPPQPGKVATVFKTTTNMDHNKVIRTKAYWLMAFAMVAYFIPYNLCGSHAAIHFKSVGVDPVLVAAGLSIMGVASIIGRVVIGLLGDKIEPIKMMGIAVPIMAIGGLFAAFSTSPVVLYVYFFAIGFGSGCGRVCIPTAVANYFGPQSYARNIALIMTTAAIFSAFVPVGGGLIFDKLGSYSAAFIGVGILGVVAGAGCLFVKPPKEVQESQLNPAIERA